LEKFVLSKTCFQIPVDWEIDALQRTQHFVAITDNMCTLNVKCWVTELGSLGRFL